MFKDTFDAAANGAVKKSTFLKSNPLGYFVVSMLAGIYVGVGNLLTNVIGGMLGSSPVTKLVMGFAFSVALSLVIFAGAELFTGNNMVMAAGILKKKVTVFDTLKLWAICWCGNICGAIVLALLFHFSGLNNEATSAFLAHGAMVKMSLPVTELIIRGMICNLLVCLGVWCSLKCKTESAVLIMVFWCIFTFVVLGGEHSVANMTQLTTALLDPAGENVTIGGYFYNLIAVTFGNILGGILLVTLPYYAASRKD
ncbi:formate/nitrite transporter family protein [Butyrivibrio sp. NC3005]|uniref:formate/nitrite transporter family protein n=1 Tax=Butyrivibrio sp. NC3005 TaxID=1280685 RepID=UPI000412C840|nr:formate/nitrite transporter family protein [Butyrivibrio sp. NC3005]